MTPRCLHRLGALALLTLSLSLTLFGPPTQAAQVLLEQAPALQPDAVANGTDGQAPRLAESFSFSGTAHTLAWWGSDALAFDVSLYAGTDPTQAPLLHTQAVGSAAAGFSTLIDGIETAVFRYTIDLGALGSGQYTLSVIETALDADSRSWFWLQGAPGDGQSITGWGEPDQASNAFDLSLQVVGDPVQRVPSPPSWALVLVGGLALVRTRAGGRRP